MKLNIGLVEDEKQIREGIAKLINEHDGFICKYTFDCAEEAINKIPLLNLNVVLMDIHLPGKSGIECVAELKPICSNTQFVMFTSYEDTDSVFNALKVGATGYLTKTTQFDKIIEAITDVYNGGSPMSSHIARKIVSSFHSLEDNIELQKLTAREKEIVEYLSKGLRYREIADKIFLSQETVRTHIRNVYEKLNVNSRTEALNKIFKK